MQNTECRIWQCYMAANAVYKASHGPLLPMLKVERDYYHFVKQSREADTSDIYTLIVSQPATRLPCLFTLAIGSLAVRL